MLQYQVPERQQTDVRLHDSKEQRIIMRNYEINSSNKETGANYSLWITQQITHTVRKVQFLKQAFETLCFLRSMQNIWVFFPPVKCSCFVPVNTLELKFTFTFTYVHTPTVLHLPDHARINAFLFVFLLPKVYFAFKLNVASARAEQLRRRGKTRVSQLKEGRWRDTHRYLLFS